MPALFVISVCRVPPALLQYELAHEQACAFAKCFWQIVAGRDDTKTMPLADLLHYLHLCWLLLLNESQCLAAAFALAMQNT